MALNRRHEGHTDVETNQYWAFGYYFETLNDQQKHQRRETLDWYGFIAQWSVLVVLVLFQLGFFIGWLLQSGLKYDQPKSPAFPKRANNALGWLHGVQGSRQKWAWWGNRAVIPRKKSWGKRAEWIGAGLWTMWLMYLSVTGTGRDYMHLTRRFGQVAASQLPIHYLLAMRAPSSPLQWLLRVSHEQLKMAHQILGRIIFVFLVLHAIFYLNFFYLSGLLAKRLKDWDVIWGLTSIALLTTLSTTALSIVRRWNYRVFYLSHIVIARLIILPLYLHVSYIRVFVYQILLVEVLHLVARAFSTKTYQGTIKLLPGTDLVQIRIPLPASSITSTWKPGQHVYLGKPMSKAKATSFTDQLLMAAQSNPFTIASLPEKDKELVVVARSLKGNTRHLADLARTWAQGGNRPMLPTANGDIPILNFVLEGPYGASKRLPELLDYDRILLVAGGVGATFIMPIYRELLALRGPTMLGMQVRCVWAVQRLADTQWAFPAQSFTEEHDSAHVDEDASTRRVLMGGLRLHGHSPIEIYVTRASASQTGASGSVTIDVDDEDGETFEMQENEQLLSAAEQMPRPREGMVVKSGRPKISEIVDEVFSKGFKTAVICCGPQRLTEEVRQQAHEWVKTGHEVFWYDETFGW